MLDKDKLSKLRWIIKQKKRIGIAYSGGVDSTLLLSIAIEVLGVTNVAAVHLNSVLQSQSSSQKSVRLVQEEFPRGLNFKQIDVFPLELPEIVKNCDERCYYCKLHMYKVLQKHFTKYNIHTIADGTNSDDMLEDRPGIKAIRQLGIFTPLENSGFTKREIRALAKKRCLPNHQLASNSCLATRIQRFMKISKKDLVLIEKAESFLESLGFSGVRVRVGGQCTIIEIEEKGFALLLHGSNKALILQKFENFGLPTSVLSLKGR